MGMWTFSLYSTLDTEQFDVRIMKIDQKLDILWHKMSEGFCKNQQIMKNHGQKTKFDLKYYSCVLFSVQKGLRFRFLKSHFTPQI